MEARLIREKNTEEEQCINEEETDEAQTKRRSFQKTWLQDHTLLGYEKEMMLCYFCRKTNNKPLGIGKRVHVCKF